MPRLQSLPAICRTWEWQVFRVLWFGHQRTPELTRAKVSELRREREMSNLQRERGGPPVP